MAALVGQATMVRLPGLQCSAPLQLPRSPPPHPPYRCQLAQRCSSFGVSANPRSLPPPAGVALQLLRRQRRPHGLQAGGKVACCHLLGALQVLPQGRQRRLPTHRRQLGACGGSGRRRRGWERGGGGSRGPRGGAGGTPCEKNAQPAPATTTLPSSASRASLTGRPSTTCVVLRLCRQRLKVHVGGQRHPSGVHLCPMGARGPGPGGGLGRGRASGASGIITRNIRSQRKCLSGRSDCPKIVPGVGRAHEQHPQRQQAPLVHPPPYPHPGTPPQTQGRTRTCRAAARPAVSGRGTYSRVSGRGAYSRGTGRGTYSRVTYSRVSGRGTYSRAAKHAPAGRRRGRRRRAGGRTAGCRSGRAAAAPRRSPRVCWWLPGPGPRWPALQPCVFGGGQGSNGLGWQSSMAADGHPAAKPPRWAGGRAGRPGHVAGAQGAGPPLEGACWVAEVHRGRSCGSRQRASPPRRKVATPLTVN